MSMMMTWAWAVRQARSENQEMFLVSECIKVIRYRRLAARDHVESGKVHNDPSDSFDPTKQSGKKIEAIGGA